jgi:hypothetical protein
MKSSVAAVVPGHAQAGGIRIGRGSIRASISQIIVYRFSTTPLAAAQ